MADEIAAQLGQLGEEIQSGDVDLSTDSSVAARLGSIANDFGSLHQLITRVHEARPSMYTFDEALNSLERISGDMQKRIMETRMVPVGPLFQRFRRLVRDMAKDLDKKIELVTNGESTELDKKLIDELSDPLTHIIRNSADHGIELPE